MNDRLTAFFRYESVTQTSRIKNSHVVTYCLLCRWANYILQPLYSESCHQETIAIALPRLVFS